MSQESYTTLGMMACYNKYYVAKRCI